jgi:hypothetical protein
VAIGEIDPAFAAAERVVVAEYEWPFQSHASLGPACAVVDARADGATLWTGSQKPLARDRVARVLGLPPDKVHGIWVPGPRLLWPQRRRRCRDRRRAAVEGGGPPGARPGHAI